VLRAQPFKTSDWTIGISVFLERSPEAYERWQLSTYNAIMLAYRLAKADYDKKVSATQAAQRTTTLLTDHEYRTVEFQELRRAALELLTDQHFDTFGSIVLVNQIPTIDNPSAFAEGPIVRFLEHAFEWNNITYVFYPYFWARKSQWSQHLALKDVDPVFSRFVSAGYARVVVPVRKGYERHISIYLKTGLIWPDGPAPIIGDAKYLPILMEMKENDALLEDNPDQDGIAEGEPWQVVLPTPLVCLDVEDVKLPSWEVKPPGKPIPYVPSEELCAGVHYNAAQWPNADAITAELTLLGYGLNIGGNADDYLISRQGRRIVRAFQRRANQIGASDLIGRPLRTDGIVGPCTLRVLSVTYDMRLRGEWPGPGVP
jgi:hypothetical protein